MAAFLWQQQSSDMMTWSTRVTRRPLLCSVSMSHWCWNLCRTEMHHCSYPADSVRKLHQVSVRTDLFISVLCWFTVPYNRWTDCEDHRCWRLVTLDVTNRRIWLWNWTRLLFETKHNQNLLNGFDVRRRFKPARQKMFSVVSTNQRKPGRKRLSKHTESRWVLMESEKQSLSWVWCFLKYKRTVLKE